MLMESFLKFRGPQDFFFLMSLHILLTIVQVSENPEILKYFFKFELTLSVYNLN